MSVRDGDIPETDDELYRLIECGATRGGAVDRTGPRPVVVGAYRCTLRPHHRGNHRDQVRKHEWAR